MCLQRGPEHGLSAALTPNTVNNVSGCCAIVMRRPLNGRAVAQMWSRSGPTTRALFRWSCGEAPPTRHSRANAETTKRGARELPPAGPPPVPVVGRRLYSRLWIQSCRRRPNRPVAGRCGAPAPPHTSLPDARVSPLPATVLLLDRLWADRGRLGQIFARHDIPCYIPTLNPD
jgi:hypothetical protein